MRRSEGAKKKHFLSSQEDHEPAVFGISKVSSLGEVAADRIHSKLRNNRGRCHPKPRQTPTNQEINSPAAQREARITHSKLLQQDWTHNLPVSATTSLQTSQRYIHVHVFTVSAAVLLCLSLWDDFSGFMFLLCSCSHPPTNPPTSPPSLPACLPVH